MTFIDTAKKAGRGLALTTAIVSALSLATAPASYARDWHGGGGGHWGGGHWGGGHHRGGHWGGGGIALGLLGGALAGAAIASAANPYYYNYSYPYPYSYSYPYDYGYGYQSYTPYYGSYYAPY